MTDKPSVKQQPKSQAIRTALCDLNGVARGKRIPAVQIDKALQGATRMPLSSTMVDIWGRDIHGSEFIFDTGDGDGICQSIRDKVLPAPWLGPQAGTIPVWMYTEDGEPSDIDPRHALAAVIQRFKEKNLTPVVATELEFYLLPIDSNNTELDVEEIYSVQQLDRLSPLLDDIYAACEAQGIAADAATSESGAGQFEVNLLHRDNALLAADDAVFFKYIVKGYARAHGYRATFMAKPKGTDAGNGMHLHFSLLDAEGHNVFDNGTDSGSDLLSFAVAGVLSAMKESTLIFAPHFNSYRRLRPNAHAPTAVCWGFENRTAAVRIPGGAAAARRIEHRVAGADANPYLVMAVVLGAALKGIENKQPPPAPIEGNAYDADVDALPDQWSAAIQAFEQGDWITDIFPKKLKRVFVQLKNQELSRFHEQVSPFELKSYAEHV